MVKTRSCDLNCGLSLDEMELINFATATACKVFAGTVIIERPRRGAKDPGKEPETPTRSQRPRQRARDPGREPKTPARSKKLSHRSSPYIGTLAPRRGLWLLAGVFGSLPGSLALCQGLWLLAGVSGSLPGSLALKAPARSKGFSLVKTRSCD